MKRSATIYDYLKLDDVSHTTVALYSFLRMKLALNDEKKMVLTSVEECCEQMQMEENEIDEQLRVLRKVGLITFIKRKAYRVTFLDMPKTIFDFQAKFEL